MKSLKLSLVALLLSAGLVSPVINAQPSDAPPPPAGERGGPGGPRGERGDRLKMLAEHLALTDAQKEQIKPIIAEEAAALKALREDTSLEREAKMAKRKEITETYRAKIRALLTPEQQAKLDAMPKPGDRRERGEGKPGKPKE